MSEQEWFAVNRLNWDERVPIHIEKYKTLPALLAGRGRLYPIEERELRIEPGQRVLHLQCHFGVDTLTLAQRGASVTGVDFSEPAITAARDLAARLGLDARFVLCNVYDAPDVLPEPASFDWVFVTWGAIIWLPDITRWARVVAHFLKPGGCLYLAEGHPAALVFDDQTATGGMPGWFAPYFHPEPLQIEEDGTYVDMTVRLKNIRTYEWIHPMGSILSALLENGLSIEAYAEHDRVPWQMFQQLVEVEDEMYTWPDKRWLPLAFSLRARKR